MTPTLLGALTFDRATGRLLFNGVPMCGGPGCGKACEHDYCSAGCAARARVDREDLARALADLGPITETKRIERPRSLDLSYETYRIGGAR